MQHINLSVGREALIALFAASAAAACHGQVTVPATGRAAQSPPAEVALGEPVTELDKTILIVFQARNDDYWFGGNGRGVYRYDGEVATHFTTRDGLCNGSIREIQEDKLGNVYFSTQEGGVSKFDGQRFTTLTVTEGSGSAGGWRLAPDDLWFKGETGKNGPYRYDGESLISLEFPKHHLADEYYANRPNLSWSPYEVYQIYKDRQGHVWFGTSNFGLCRYDGQALSWLYEQHLTEIEGGGWFGIRSLLEDEAGDYWFCNSKFRYRVAPAVAPDDAQEGLAVQALRATREAGLPDLRSVHGGDRVYFMSLLRDRAGVMWMASYNEGVWRYDGAEATHFPVVQAGEPVTLFSIYEDNAGTLWLGTHEHGALRFNGQSFERFRPEPR